MKFDAQNCRGEHHIVTGKLVAQAVGSHHAITVIDMTQPDHHPAYFIVFDFHYGDREGHTDTVFFGENAKDELLAWLVDLLGSGRFMPDWYIGIADSLDWMIARLDDRDLQVYKVLNQLSPHRIYDRIIASHPT